VTSPRDVRFTPNNGRWTGHPSQHLAVGLETPRDEGVPITVVSFTLLLRLLLGAKMPLVTLEIERAQIGFAQQARSIAAFPKCVGRRLTSDGHLGSIPLC
jgi:hypothetical protein